MNCANAFAVPVDNSEPRPSGQISLIEEFIHLLASLFGGRADNVDFRRRVDSVAHLDLA